MQKTIFSLTNKHPRKNIMHNHTPKEQIQELTHRNITDLSLQSKKQKTTWQPLSAAGREEDGGSEKQSVSPLGRS